MTQIDYRLNSWINHKKNVHYNQRQGVCGLVVVNVIRITPFELILAPEYSSDSIVIGKGSFVILMKPINRWVVITGEIVAGTNYGNYKRNIFGKYRKVFDRKANSPPGGVTLKMETIKFCALGTMFGYNTKEYRLINGAWKLKL